MSYFKLKINSILAVYLLSLIISIFIVPTLTDLNSFKQFIANPDIYHLIGIISIYLLILLISFKRLQVLTNRFINSLSLRICSFSYIDFAIWFSLFFIVNAITFNAESLYTMYNFAWVIFSLIVISLVSLLILFFTTKSTKIQDKEIRLESYSDNPILQAKQDLLNRREFVNSFSNELKSLLVYDEYSFVFGLYGSWGEGKTSFINLVKETIQDDKNFMIVEFNPWQYKDKQAIIYAFFNEIENQISNSYILSNFSKSIKKYIKLLSFGFVNIDLKLNIDLESDNFSDVKQEIQSKLYLIKKKLVIIIDDLDRLQFDEIMLIYKIVPLNAKFNNICFVLCFDPVKIRQYLEANKFEKDYIEKIVNKAFYLPLPPQKAIEEYLFNGISDILLQNKVGENDINSFIKEFSYKYNLKIREQFQNIRNIKLFLNCIKIDLPLIIKEINVVDYCLLAIIKTFYPMIFEHIKNQPNDFINTPISAQYSYRELFYEDRKGDETNQKQRIDDLLLKEKNLQLVKYLLCSLFPKISNLYKAFATERNEGKATQRFEKRISDSESFHKYFQLDVRIDEIPDYYIEKKIYKWNISSKDFIIMDISESIKLFIEDSKLDEFLRKISIFNKLIEENTIKHVIEAICLNMEIFPDTIDRKHVFGLSEYYRAEGLFMELINERVKPLEMQPLLIQLINTATHMPIIVYIAFSCIKEKNDFYNVNKSVNKDIIVNETLKKLRKHYIINKVNIFEELKQYRELTFVLYQWAVNWNYGNENHYDEVNNYILSIVNHDFNSFVVLILRFSREDTKWQTESIFFQLDDLVKMCDIKELNLLAKKYSKTSDIDSEILKYINEFINASDNFINNKR